MDALKKLAPIAFLFLSACQLTYLAKGAYNQLDILYHREPIERVLKRPDLSEKMRAKLHLTLEVRKFAEETLRLKIANNYSTFVDLHRPYVVWAVNASPQWNLEHYLWSFPIVGQVPYKGFPKETDAQDEAKNLKDQGYDTFVRGVRAYSTLGWFSDPLLSSMIDYSDEDLVNTIIHESVHATLYIKSNADFNERLATFVGDKGTELFYLQKEGPQSPHLKSIQEDDEDQKLFSKFISKEIQKLKDFYIQQKNHDLSLRETKFDEIKTRFREEIKPLLKSDAFSQFERTKLNNARLMLYKTYIEDLSDFHRFFKKLDENLPLFITKIKSLEDKSNPIDALKKL